MEREKGNGLRTDLGTTQGEGPLRVTRGALLLTLPEFVT